MTTSRTRPSSEAGVTDFIKFAAVVGFGGVLDVLLFQSLELGRSLDRRGFVSGVTGEAAVSGTVTCSVPVLSNDTPGVCVSGTLRQSRRGTLTEAEVLVCTDFNCDTETVSQEIHLRGGGR